jgi:hypothetical protein
LGRKNVFAHHLRPILLLGGCLTHSLARSVQFLFAPLLGTHDGVLQFHSQVQKRSRGPRRSRRPTRTRIRRPVAASSKKIVPLKKFENATQLKEEMKAKELK